MSNGEKRVHASSSFTVRQRNQSGFKKKQMCHDIPRRLLYLFQNYEQS